MEELDFNQQESVESLPIADISAPHGGSNVSTTTRNFTVKISQKDADDFVVEVNASDLTHIRDKATSYLEEQRFLSAELLLGFGCVSIGATLSALLSRVPLDSTNGFVFYIIAPVFAVGLIVKYSSDRKLQMRTGNDLAKDILSEISNPDDAIEKVAEK